MDLSNLNVGEAASRGADMHLCHPLSGDRLKQDDGSYIVIRLLGADAPEYRQRVHRIANKNVQRRKKSAPSAEQIEEQTVSLLAAITVGWEGIVVNGEALEFSEQAAKELYQDHVWIREQVDEFVADRANFLA
jgi:hypothetical protein